MKQMDDIDFASLLNQARDTDDIVGLTARLYDEVGLLNEDAEKARRLAEDFRATAVDLEGQTQIRNAAINRLEDRINQMERLEQLRAMQLIYMKMERIEKGRLQ